MNGLDTLCTECREKLQHIYNPSHLRTYSKDLKDHASTTHRGIVHLGLVHRMTQLAFY